MLHVFIVNYFLCGKFLSGKVHERVHEGEPGGDGSGEVQSRQQSVDGEWNQGSHYGSQKGHRMCSPLSRSEHLCGESKKKGSLQVWYQAAFCFNYSGFNSIRLFPRVRTWTSSGHWVWMWLSWLICLFSTLQFDCAVNFSNYSSLVIWGNLCEHGMFVPTPRILFWSHCPNLIQNPESIVKVKDYIRLKPDQVPPQSESIPIHFQRSRSNQITS